MKIPIRSINRLRLLETTAVTTVLAFTAAMLPVPLIAQTIQPFSSLPLLPPSSSGTPIARINAGGGQYIDTTGQTWAADQYFSGSSYAYATVQTITGTNDPTLFKDERSGNNGSSFGYQIPVTNGVYNVNLHFAELYWQQVGKRVFDVDIENQSLLRNFDIYSEVGALKDLIKSTQVTVTDGILNINFKAMGVDNPEVTALEILRAGDIPPAAGALAFSAPTFTVNEDGTFLTAVTVNRTGGTSGAVSAIVTPSNGTALAPGDYNNAPITLNFANGDTAAKTVTIPIVNDTLIERVEGLNLTLSNVTGGAVLGTQASATLSIVDNDLMSGFNKLNWATKAPATERASESLGAVVNGKFFLFGGFNTDDFVSSTSQRVTVYDLATNTWKRLGDMPTQLTHSPTIVVGLNVYFIGGYVGLHPNNLPTTAVWKYDTIGDTWTPFVPLPVAHGAGAAALVTHADGKRYIHFFGGVNATRTLDSGEHFFLCLDDPNPTWVPAAPMPNPRNHLGGGGINGKVYAVGGQHKEEGNIVPQTEVDVYDPANGTWTQAASLPIPRSEMGSGTSIWNGRIIVAGGLKALSTPVANVTSYDPSTNKWTELTPLPIATNSGVARPIGSELIYSTGYDYSRPGQGDFTWSGLALSSAPTPVASSVTLTPANASTSVNTPVSYQATVKDQSGATLTTATGNVVFTVSGGATGTFSPTTCATTGAPLSGGVATCSFAPSGTGTATVSATYSGLPAATATLTVASSTGVTPIRVEAESMTLNTYRIEANSSASGGKLLSLKDGAVGVNETGTATYSFTGPAGNYDVVVGYYDENDGVAQMSLSKDGVVLNAWSLNQNLGSPDAVAQTFVRRTVATAISIASGSVFKITGTENSGEKARVDYIEFIPK